jgi:hypothetical protein
MLSHLPRELTITYYNDAFRYDSTLNESLQLFLLLRRTVLFCKYVSCSIFEVDGPSISSSDAKSDGAR